MNLSVVCCSSELVDRFCCFRSISWRSLCSWCPQWLGLFACFLQECPGSSSSSGFCGGIEICIWRWAGMWGWDWRHGQRIISRRRICWVSGYVLGGIRWIPRCFWVWVCIGMRESLWWIAERGFGPVLGCQIVVGKWCPGGGGVGDYEYFVVG